MADDSYNNGDERESKRGVHRDDETLSSDANERELLRMLRENPELQAKLRAALDAQSAPKSPSKPPVSSAAPSFPDASIPTGLPVAKRSSPRSNVPSGLPTASRSTDRFSPLPDAFRRDGSTTSSRCFTNAESRAPLGRDVAPTHVDSNDDQPQQVPVPPRLDQLETSSESVPEVYSVATAKRGKSKTERKESSERESETAPDLSAMAPLSARSEGDLATLGTMLASFPATTNVASLVKATPDALGILTTDETWNQSTPDVFLGLLEKRKPQTPETAS